MKTTRLFLVCLCSQLTLALSAGEVSKTDKSSQAAEFARQADARLQDASSPQDYREAAALLEKSVKLDPGDLDVQQKLGWVYLEKLHEPQTAYPHLAMVAKNRPDDVDARKLCGMACSQTGRKWKAVEEFRAAAKLQPDDLWIRANLARSLARTGQTDEAETIYAGILKADPANADARLGQAEIAAWRGHTAGPLQTLNQLAAENPTNADVLTLRGDIHRWNWDLTEARQDYQQVLNAGPNYAAWDGLQKAHWMGASGITVKGYEFKDNADFQRESLEADARVHLADPVYLLAGVAGWRFSNPGFSDLDRGDGTAGLEIHFAQWLEMSAVGNVFDYENRAAFFGGRFSTKISPVSGTDIYANVAYNQPFVSSISTVESGMKEESVGLGLDTKLAGRLSFQAAGELARLSDQNKWWEARPQLSYRVFDIPATFLRAEYDYLSYSQTKTTYWTPRNRHTVGPVLDTSIPLVGKSVHLDADAKAPFIFDESKFGFQVEGGPVIDLFNHVQLKASYYYSSIPGDQGAWSGRGWQASVQIRF